jgi:hypothetical protein
MELNKRHKLFIDEYMTNGMNVTNAYSKVYKNDNRGTCEVNGHRLLRNPKVQQEIEKRQAKVTAKLDIKKEDILMDLLKIKEAFLLSGKNTGNAIKALDMINKMLGLYESQKIEHTGSMPISIIKTIEVKKDGTGDKA